MSDSKTAKEKVVGVRDEGDVFFALCPPEKKEKKTMGWARSMKVLPVLSDSGESRGFIVCGVEITRSHTPTQTNTENGRQKARGIEVKGLREETGGLEEEEEEDLKKKKKKKTGCDPWGQTT